QTARTAPRRAAAPHSREARAVGNRSVHATNRRPTPIEIPITLRLKFLSRNSYPACLHVAINRSRRRSSGREQFLRTPGSGANFDRREWSDAVAQHGVTQVIRSNCARTCDYFQLAIE